MRMPEVKDAQRDPAVMIMQELPAPWTPIWTADANSTIVLPAGMFNAGEGRAQSEKESDIMEVMLQEIQNRQCALNKWVMPVRDWHEKRGNTKMSMLQPPLKEDETKRIRNTSLHNQVEDPGQDTQAQEEENGVDGE